MARVTFKPINNYTAIIERCKFLYTSMRVYQAEIAYHAVTVCDIKHGGNSSGLYTISKFASDVGVPRKALSEWIGIYKNVTKELDIQIETITEDQWAKCRQVDKAIRKKITLMNAMEGVKQSKSASEDRRKAFKKDVKAMYEKLEKKDYLEGKLISFNCYAVATKNNMAGKDLSQVSLSVLLSLKENCDAISDMVLRHVKTRKVK